MNSATMWGRPLGHTSCRPVTAPGQAPGTRSPAPRPVLYHRATPYDGVDPSTGPALGNPRGRPRAGTLLAHIEGGES